MLRESREVQEGEKLKYKVNKSENKETTEIRTLKSKIDGIIGAEQNIR